MIPDSAPEATVATIPPPADAPAARRTDAPSAHALAHDLNNVIMVIRGYVELLVAGVPATHPARAHLAALEEAIGNAARIVQALRGVRSPVPEETVALDLDGFLASRQALLEHLLGDGIQLELRLGLGELPLMVDPARLDQAIMNLALNARDAMFGHGRLSISTAAVEIGPSAVTENADARPGCYARLSVVDDGCGMDAETRQRACEPHFTTKGTHGSGMGLGVVQDLVRDVGGFLALESEIGRGTCVDLYLPRR